MVNLWIGTGVHFAFEDYCGYNRYGNPVIAFEAFCNAHKASEVPDFADDAIELCMGMLEYYPYWYEQAGRPKYNTVWIDGVPQVEVEFRLELKELSAVAGYPVVYHGTFDRVVQDEEGMYWVEDYKTTRTMDYMRMATDPQMKAYTWAAEQVYGMDFEGAIMTQLLKSYPKPPNRLKTGGFSQDIRQKTTYGLYRQALLDAYGNVPTNYVEFLNKLAAEESVEGNRFIRRDCIHHNRAVKENTYNSIILEGKDMLNLELPLYPNETMNCSWDCGAFRNVCIVREEGGDYEELLRNDFVVSTRGKEEPRWRKRLEEQWNSLSNH